MRVAKGLAAKKRLTRSRLGKCAAVVIFACSLTMALVGHRISIAMFRGEISRQQAWGGPGRSSLAEDEHDSDASNRGDLKCDEFGGPSDASDVVYWLDSPRDRKKRSPYGGNGDRKKYLTVELDAGGYNNVRMTVEIAMAWARATGRVFVVPPRQGIYLMKGTYTLHDFYDLGGLDTMDMADFLQQEVIDSGHFGLYPPGNRTDWSEFAPRLEIFENENADSRQLNRFLRTIGWSPKWLPGQKLLFIPEDPDGGDAKPNNMARQPEPNPPFRPWKDRLREVIQGRDVVIYDHEPDLIHIMADDDAWVRMMHHYYYTIFIQSPTMDLWIKRFVRDTLRYKDEIFCVAGQIVKLLRLSSERQGSDGRFYTFHIRRGDFAHIGLVDDAKEIVDATKGIVPKDATVYIATDEDDRSWFSSFHERYKEVYYLDNFQSHLKAIDSSFYGFIDQIVAARGDAFFGAYKSTFSAQIITMMGHYSQTNKSPGYEDGEINAYFYAPSEVKYAYREGYRAFRGDEDPIDMAYPLAWRGIDEDYQRR